jgi:hypothetical protein
MDLFLEPGARPSDLLLLFGTHPPWLALLRSANDGELI